MKYYHGTTEENALSIIKDKTIYTGYDKCVYLCSTPQDCIKFLSIRGVDSVYVFEVDIPEHVSVQESFDHNENFFKCKAYYIDRNIPEDWIVDSVKVYRRTD